MTHDHCERGRAGAEEKISDAARKAQLRQESEAAELDEALEDSFPASDPLSIIQPRIHPGAPERDPSRRTAGTAPSK